MTVPLSAFRAAPTRVQYRYYFTDFITARLRAVLPLRDVKLSDVLSGASTGEAVLPLSDENVRKADPFSATIPARSCMWAERQELHAETGLLQRADLMWSGIVMKRTRSRSGRAMGLNLVTWPSYFAASLIGYDAIFTQRDKFEIMRYLLQFAVGQPYLRNYYNDAEEMIYGDSPHMDPMQFLQGTGGNASGVLADRTYLAADLKTVLSAMTELARSGNGFDWRVVPQRAEPSQFINTLGKALQVRMDLGYPRLGRIAPADLRWSTRREDRRSRWGYVEDYTLTEDRSDVYNAVTALGGGQGDEQLRYTATNSGEWLAGYPAYATSLGSGTQDLLTQDSVTQHAIGALNRSAAGQTKLTGIKVRGDLAPQVNTYMLGDDLTFRLDETTTGQPMTITGQLVGRTIEPPQQGRSETVTLDVQGSVAA